jgi:hypothetical protein
LDKAGDPATIKKTFITQATFRRAVILEIRRIRDKSARRGDTLEKSMDAPAPLLRR